MDTSGNVSRVGIGLFACGSARVAGNQLSNIGPLNQTFGPSAGIAVTGPPFDRAEVSNNVVRRSDVTGQSTGDSTLWRAIYIGALSAFAGGFTYQVVQVAERFFLVGDFTVLAAFLGEQVAAVRGNVMEAESFSAVAELSVSGSCVFADNQGTLFALGNARAPLAVLSAPMVVASNNILNFGAPPLQINAPEGKYTVLGNITTTSIMVNNQNLAGVWAPLNVHG
jgi:hypothetical protein